MRKERKMMLDGHVLEHMWPSRIKMYHIIKTLIHYIEVDQPHRFMTWEATGHPGPKPTVH